MLESKRSARMEALLRVLCAILFVHPFGAAASESLLGVHPLDEKYYLESELINCKDKSSSFTRDRLNDDFCDCVDGSDEPGTSACPEGRFYCKNVGSTPQFLFSSRVNDHICDCCDGSDEYDGSIYCPSACIMGGNIEYKSQTHHYNRLNSLHGDAISAKRNKLGTRLEDLIDNVKGLKTVALAQLVLLGTGAIAILVMLCVVCRCCQRTKLRRRRHR